MPWNKETLAAGKINLYFDITGKRDDAYHSVDTVMQSIDMADQLRAHMMTEAACIRQFNDEKKSLPPSADLGPALAMSIEFSWFSQAGSWLSEEEIRTNSCFKAATVFWTHAVGEEGMAAGPKQRLLLRVNKRIPAEAGLGGGSADAAALLDMLWTVYGKPFPYDDLWDLAASIGADVPFCLQGGTRYCQGLGEEISYLPSLPSWEVLIVKPNKGSSTPEAYQAYDDAVESGEIATLKEAVGNTSAFRTKLTEIVFNAKVGAFGVEEPVDLSPLQELGGNVFIPLISKQIPEISNLIEGLQEMYPQALTGMSGSGTACFVLFGSRESGIELGSLHRFLDKTIGQGEYKIFRTRLKKSRFGTEQ